MILEDVIKVVGLMYKIAQLMYCNSYWIHDNNTTIRVVVKVRCKWIYVNKLNHVIVWIAC